MKIVFLNGPPHCGKDTAAERLATTMPCQLLKFAAPIKRMVCGALGETLQWLEKNKDRPDPRLNGETPRKFLIALSEDLIKPRYGDQFFGRCMVGELDKLDANGGVVYGASNCLKVEIHREGKTFDGDSRSYWHMPELRTVRLHNDGTIDQLPEKLFGILSNVWGCTR
jgi:hypothetical protein